jgi:uncharacterized protein YfaT (DUF1175 family)
MRAYQVLMLTGLVSMVLLGLLLSASLIATPKITAEVDIAPEVFNLKRMDAPNGVITAYISNLTENGFSYDVRDINVSTIGLYYEGQLITTSIRTAIENDTLIVKFDATQVANWIWTHIVYHVGTIPPQENFTITLTVSGQLINEGERFSGNDSIKIILP